MRLRKVPGTSLELPEIGAAIRLQSGDVPPDPFGLGLLRRCVRLGVTFLDVSAASPLPPAELLVGGAMSSTAAAVKVGTRFDVVHPLSRKDHGGPTPEPSLEGHGVSGPPFSFAPLQSELEAHLRRLGRSRLDVLWITGLEPEDLVDGSLAAGLERLIREGSLSAWGPYLESNPAASDLLRACAGSGARVASVMHNLLFRRQLPVLATEWAGTVGFVIRNPHADGRLDGSFLRAGLASPPSSPKSIDHLAAFLAPVTTLGFLTAGHRRTLGQAAIQFVLSSPSVVCVTPPLTLSAPLQEWVETIDRPTLSETELEQIAHLPESSSPLSGS